MAQTPYVDLGTIKQYLTIPDTTTTYDNLLTILITGVSDFVEEYTGRTWGWGDTGDQTNVDYSNSDNVGVLSASIDGDLLTVNTMGPVPWVAGQNVSMFLMPESAWDGVFAVSEVLSPTSLVVNISEQTGTLSPSDNPDVTSLPAANFAGYIGNAVVNYKYMSTDQYDGLVGKMFYLRNMDIRSIDTLYIGLRNIAQPVLLDHTQYEWRNDGRVILGGAYFNSYDSGIYAQANDNSFYGTVAAGYQTIMVNYWYGGIGVPSKVQLAVCDIISAFWNIRNARGLLEERAGDYNLRYDPQFAKLLKESPDLLGTLDNMRRIKI